jgi:alkylation response protein AidB-like acyl-CoA dehydrogenase
MNLALSDEQVFLREAARGALSRFKTLEAARDALDTPQGGTPHGGGQAGGQGELPDLWPVACEAGWPGLLIDDAHGGAALDAFDAMLVMGECGRVLAGVAMLGHLPATAILSESAAPAAAALLPPLASGEQRAAYLPACPPNDVFDSWCVDPPHGSQRPQPPVATGAGEGHVTVTGTFAFVPDAPAADVLVGTVLLDTPQGGTPHGGGQAGGKPVGVAIKASAEGVRIEAIRRYDATRSLGHVTLENARAVLLDTPVDSLAAAWHLAQALLAAESIGAVETALDVSVAYAKERHTFGRAIGSYQAVKHSLTEVLRQQENGRSLLYYAGWARRGAPGEFALAAAAARSVAGHALDTAARTMISVHGGIGATWEHDAPLYFRRAQLSRRLLGGTNSATDRVAGELLTQAAQAA